MPADLKARLDALPVPGYRDQIELFQHLRATWHDKDGMRIILGPCGPQRCSTALLEEVAGLSADLDLPIHCHVLETKTQAVTGQRKYNRTLPQFLADVGCMTHRLTMNHAIWLTEGDIELLGGVGGSITHNPLANLKLGSGVAPIRKLKNAGANIALGCDGVASADTADMFSAFKAASLIHKIGTHDYREWVSAHEVMHMATHGAARSSLMQDEVGSIEVGKQADIILLDRYHWGFIPLHDPIQQIAFSADQEAVRTSIVGGRVVMRERKLALVDEEAIRMEISEAAERFRREDCPRMSKGAAEVRPYLDEMHTKATGSTVEAGHIPLPDAAGRGEAVQRPSRRRTKMDESGRWVGRNSEKDAIRGGIWDGLVADGVNVGPVRQPHPELRRRRPRRLAAGAGAGMEDGAGGEGQSRPAADPGAAPRPLRGEDRLHPGAGADQGLPLRAPRPGGAHRQRASSSRRRRPCRASWPRASR